MQLNLLVLHSSQPTLLADFYSKLGLNFEYHQHGSGPMNYSANCNGLVFEIYPARKPEQVNPATRLGFRIKSLDTLLARLESNAVKVVQPASSGPWGYRAVIEDLEGRKVELVEE